MNKLDTSVHCLQDKPHDNLVRQLDRLQTAPREKLIKQWRAMFKIPIPANLSSKLIRRAIGYELQAQQFGKMSPALRQRLSRIARQGSTSQNSPTVSPRPALKPGTRLLRDWNGQTYQVDVTEDGFDCDGKTYRSLSAIAKAITGAHWSGPRFFGLKLASVLRPVPSLNASVRK